MVVIIKAVCIRRAADNLVLLDQRIMIAPCENVWLVTATRDHAGPERQSHVIIEVNDSFTARLIRLKSNFQLRRTTYSVEQATADESVVEGLNGRSCADTEVSRFRQVARLGFRLAIWIISSF